MNKKLNDNEFIDWLFDRDIYHWEDKVWMSNDGFMDEEEIIDLYPDFLKFTEALDEFQSKKK